MKGKVTDLRALAFLAVCGLALVAGCQSVKGDKGDEAAAPLAGSDVKTAAAKSASDCGKAIVSTSSHAVGDPCLTTADIAKGLGLTPEQVARLEKKVGKKHTAHH